MNNKKILLVGGCGFIGHNLAILLKKSGADPIVVDSLTVNNLFSIADEEIKNKELYSSILNNRIDILEKNKKNKNKNINRNNKPIDNKINEAFKKLNLTLDSSLHDIKRQYKILVKKYHPDANKNNVKSNNKLIEINEAYKIIIDNY